MAEIGKTLSRMKGLQTKKDMRVERTSKLKNDKGTRVELMTEN